MDAKKQLAFYHAADEKYQEYKKLLENNKETLMNTKSVDEKVKKLKNLYTFMKEVSGEFYYEATKEFQNFDLLSYLLLGCENALGKEYILDTTSNFHMLKDLNLGEEELIANKIVYWTRKALLKELEKQEKHLHPFDFYDVSNDCEFASKKTLKISNKMSISYYRIKIEPGFFKDSLLCNGSCFHYFNIVIMKDIPYLVDCTYKQFLVLEFLV